MIDWHGRKGLAAAPALLLVVLLAGCADGIELNGKVFDMIGMGVGPKAEARMPERGTLVIPPATAALPAPGSGGEATATMTAQLPNDPDQVAAAARKQVAKKTMSECAMAQRQSGTDPQAIEEKCPGLFSSVAPAVTNEEGAVEETVSAWDNSGVPSVSAGPKGTALPTTAKP